MQSSVIATDGTVKSMVLVCLSTGLGHRRGASIADIEEFLESWAPSGREMYHEGAVERVLRELQDDGWVAQMGRRWFLVRGSV